MAANIPATIGDWSTTDASNQPDGTDTTDIAGEYRRIQAVVRKYFATATTLAAGATTDLSTAAGNTVTLTGAATTISSFGTVAAGLDYAIIANAAHTLTYNATSLILPTSADITLAAGDVIVMTSEGSGNWRCKAYMPRAGYQPLDADLTYLAGSLSAFARTFVDDADAATFRATTGTEPTLLAEYTVAGAAVSSIQFAGLDINTHKSYRIEIDVLNATAGSIGLSMYVNADTTATNYYTQVHYSSSTTVAGARANDAKIGTVPASSVNSEVIHISLSATYPTATVSESQGVGSTIVAANWVWAKTATVANITQLDFVASAALSLGIGSTIRIYRGDK